MKIDLNGLQDVDNERDGAVLGANGRRYVRRTSRAKRPVCDELVASGSPMIVEFYATGQFEWFDSEEAVSAWSLLRPHVVAGQPTDKQLAKHAAYYAAVWEDADGNALLYLTGRC